jgi:hypothetical protein
MSAVLALALALQAREELVAVPKTDLEIPFVHVPVEGTPLRPYALEKHETPWGGILPFHGKEPWAQSQADGLTRPSEVLGFFDQLGMPAAFLKPERPANALHWHTAMTYCDWLTALTGRKFRLPTEAEWERAAKSEGADVAPTGKGTRAAAESRPNALGFKDLVGNVWELCLEPMNPPGFGAVYRGGSWDTAPERLGPGLRVGVQPRWSEMDPLRPRSSWWFFGGQAQGMRLALVGDEAAVRDSKQYVPKIEVSIKRFQKRRSELAAEGGKVEAFEPVVTVHGEVRNAGDRTVDELELQVFYLTPEGKPHWVEREGASHPWRPNFTWVYPVLANSAHEGPRAPLGPGESRAFIAEVPETFDPDAFVNANAFGARVSWVRLASK